MGPRWYGARQKKEQRREPKKTNGGHSGEIIIDGRNILEKKVDSNKVREDLGMVFQHFNLFSPKTVLENVTLAMQHKIMMFDVELGTPEHFFDNPIHDRTKLSLSQIL